MAKTDNVVLIGMPGAGKSTVGVVVAKMLGLDFLDADLLIQRMHGRTLEQIIGDVGAEGFIGIENEVLRDIECERTLIAPGGSAIYSDEGMAHLREAGTIVYLEVPLEDLYDRLGELAQRGVVMRGSCTTLAELYEERVPLYERWADVRVGTHGLNLRETAEAVVRALHGLPS